MKFLVINNKGLFIKLFESIEVYSKKISHLKRNYELKQFNMNGGKLKDKIYYYFVIIIEKSFFVFLLSILFFVLFFIPLYIINIFILPELIQPLFFFIYITIIYHISGRLRNTYNFIDENGKIIHKKGFYLIQKDFTYLKDRKLNIDNPKIDLLSKNTIYKFLKYIDKGYILVSLKFPQNFNNNPLDIEKSSRFFWNFYF